MKFGGLNNLKFAKFDCNLYPDVAASSFNVSSSPLGKQLPTIVLFQKGAETKRRPFVDSKGNVFNFIFSYENIVKEFDLNKIYYECKSSQIVVRPLVPKAADNNKETVTQEEQKPKDAKEKKEN